MFEVIKEDPEYRAQIAQVVLNKAARRSASALLLCVRLGAVQ